MTETKHSQLVDSVRRDILKLIQEHNLAPGARLVERKLGEELKVSRSPIRKALQALEAEGTVERSPQGGIVVSEVPAELPPHPGAADENEVYYKLAEERLNGQLPDRITENFLLRHYDLTRTELTELLRRISNEGWIERLPGYGWEFQPMLDTVTVYQDSYRFRLTIEPAAILEPSFVVNREKLLKCREEQQRLVDGGIWEASNAELFDSNSALHETIMNCSNNTFFSDALQKVDKLRRLIEYRKSLPRDRALARCKEHLAIIDLLLDGKLETASTYMREHLSSVSLEKTSDQEAATDVP